MIEWKFVGPGRFSPFIMGRCINEISHMNPVLLHREDDGDETFECIGDKAKIHTSNGHIRSIECWEYFNFYGENIVKCDFISVLSLISSKYGPWIQGDSRAEFEQLGFWVWEEEGRVDSITLFMTKSAP
jgi:hypothetical protein